MLVFGAIGSARLESIRHLSRAGDNMMRVERRRADWNSLLQLCTHFDKVLMMRTLHDMLRPRFHIRHVSKLEKAYKKRTS